MKKLLGAFCFLLFALPALADDKAPVVYAQIPAHPALWTVHGPKGTAYLFGSIHILPPNIDWHTKEIDAALAKSDVMVFEIAFDDKLQADLQASIKSRGMLPEGQHLRDLLSPEAKGEFDTELAHLSLPSATVDQMRPWLAAMMFEVAEMRKKHYDSTSGVEMNLRSSDGIDKRPVVGLETIDQQLAMIAPSDPKVELEAFEAALKSSATEGPDDDIGPMLDAWMNAKVARLDTLMNKAFQNYPAARKALLDDRNAAWVKKISALLDEPKTYFITVGAGHLAGPRGVPALLRTQGFRVEGP